MAISKKPVAYLARELVGGGTQEMLFEGILSATESSGQHLVVLRGGYLGKDPGSVIYELVNKDFHGVISWAAADADEYSVRFHQRYSGIPVATLTQQIKPHPVIIVDSYLGMRAVMDHLIGKHGKQKIAFIRGPENHPLAQDRYRAYQDVLKDAGISAEEKRISPCCTWGKEKGAEMVALFVDERHLVPGVDFDALVCVNDNIAIGAIEEFQRRGIHVPDVIAVTGFNDAQEARTLTPPVTTVAVPSDEQITKALEVINSAGAPRSDAFKLAAKLVIGQSCGCPSHKVEAALSGAVAMGQKFGMRERAASTLKAFWFFDSAATAEAMKDSILSQLNTKKINEQLLRTVALNVVDAFSRELSRRKHRGQFMAALIDAIKQFSDEKVPTDLLQNYISVLRQRRLPTLRRRSNLIRAEDIWAQGRVMLDEAAGRLRASSNLKAMALERAIGQLGAKLASTHETAAILKTLQQDLPKLGIPALYLALYENEPGWDRKTIPAQLQVITAFNTRGAVRFDGSQARMPCTALMPKILSLSSERQALMAMPLHFNETQIGLAVFGIGPRDGSIYESIKVQLSSALYGALLRQTLKETLATMERKVSEVSGNSEQINQSVQGGSSAMSGVANSIQEISQNIKEVMQVISNAVSLTAEAGRDITTLNNQSDEISKILGFITEIANQTNMLSLNAAIEAARAGEAGRGFAVVAQEVKTLAVNTVKSSASISSVIGSVQQNTRQVFASMSSINEIMNKVAELSAGISQAISEQEGSTQEISAVLLQASRGTSQIADVLAEINAISKDASQI